MSVFKYVLLLSFISCSSVYQSGKASWYGKKYHGKKTASGQVYNMYLMTAAHRELPFGTKVMVKNESNGKEVVVRINDRGPFIDGRIIDLSKKAAQKLGMIQDGETEVSLLLVK